MPDHTHSSLSRGGGGQGMDTEVNLGYTEAGFCEIQQPNIAMPDFSPAGKIN